MKGGFDLTWAENGVYIGYCEVDGFWVFAPNRVGGYWNEVILYAIADWLTEKNAPYVAELERSFR